MLLTRSPLEVIGMNGAQQQPKRRSARLSAEGAESENEPPRRNGVQTMSVSTKETDGGEAVMAAKKKRKGKTFCCTGCMRAGIREGQPAAGGIGIMNVS